MTSKNIGERYILQRELGSGGMGTVYLGLDNTTNQQVAIKQLKADVAQSENIERFKREGEALRDLNHPNIVKMLNMFEYDGQHYLVMDYVTGGDLSKLIREHTKIEVQQCVDMAIDLADALTRAHRLNIIHRDLKPANVLIDKDGVLHLTDFGVAHVGSKERVTDTDAIIGTIDYLPPEAFNSEPYDARGDIWAFGVMLFEMLAGQRPFTGQTLMETIQAIVTQPIPDLEALCPDAPVILVDLIYRMLERNPQARIPSVRIVGTELEAILEGRDKAIPTKRFDTDIPMYTDRPKHNLTAQSTPFVGREHELGELDKLLKDPTLRLITILAQGGMGKTRLSLELAKRAVDAGLYTDGVYFVELAPLSDSANIPNAIGDACGFQFLGEGTPKEQLISILGERQLLLVVDNYEHLSDGFGLVGELLKNAPNIHIIATSRQRLSQSGETLFHLSGMDFPTWETPDDALDYAAVKLFMNSAKRAQPSFELTGNNLDSVAKICKLVQGMPLGIVLAASWLSLLSLSEIVDEIQTGLDFLETDEIELPERQRSIRAIMDYSWTQMTDAEQQVFMKLSVFKGGFSREAAGAITGATLRALMSLMNKSLIRRDADGGRYSIHELLRQYAEEQLQQAKEQETVAIAHMTYFAEFMAQHTIDIKGRRQIDGLNEVEADFDNIRDAWHYAVNQANYEALDQMMEALALYFDMRAMYKVGEDLFEDAVNQLSTLNAGDIHPTFNRLRLRALQVWILQEKSPVPEIQYNLIDECIEVAKQHHDQHTIMLCYWLKGEFGRIFKNIDTSFADYEQGQTLAQEIIEPYYEGRILRGIDYISRGNLGKSLAISLEINHQHQEHLRQINDINGLSHAIFYQSVLRRDRGDIEGAFRDSQEARIGWQLTKDLKSIGVLILGQGRTDFHLGKLDSSEIQLLEGIDISSRMNFTLNHAATYSYLSLIMSIRGQYDTSLYYIEKAFTMQSSSYVSWKHRTYLSRAIYAISVQDFEQAKLDVLTAITSPIKAAGSSTMILAISAFVLHHNQNDEYAIELLGRAYSEHPSQTGWMHKWDLLDQLQADLKSQLGDEAYDDAWERGKSLDLETVIQDLIDHFSDADSSVKS
jgi:serine/threonine protein kinase/tetratricopeptide (TPR) repeat protein